jgi:hypothetical protein
MTAVTDIEQLPLQVRRVAQKSTPALARLAHRIAEMPRNERRTARREAEATFRQMAAVNGLIGLMVERYIRYMLQALDQAVSKIDD